MKRFILAAATLSAVIAAQAQIYQWQDENNKTVISDRPPPGTVRPQRKIEAAAPPATASGKTLADREMEFRKRQKESREAAEKADQEARESTKRRQNCDSARNTLRALENGERVVLRDSKGEAFYPDDKQRAEQIARRREEIKNDCR
ncbi:MAG: DUF4124 domain-containing protein [Candidatus Accumulibacter sp.]|jgi:hypothetical protein|uniref:DUF4124 domain-containing protein n=1 Tax=Accumulibacter sp. TaxID=2053492 RepID=UPI001A49C985|nr:DUF4124 domain-containing protein [Accumulibacter sp.]MBL8396213.1 DUF4124 domain-containing protein [Accumulibacter sp.]